MNINGRYLVQRVTGQQRYAREIVARFTGDIHIVEPASYAKGIRGHLWEQFQLPCKCGDSLLWSPSTTGPLSVRRQVVTVHDCSFVDHADCFSFAFSRWYQFLVPKLAKRVRRIITISEFSKHRILEICKIPEEKVEVIYNGVDSRFRVHSPDEIQFVKRILALPERFVLCVGSIEPRKNLARLLQAWRLLQHELPGFELVLAGSTGSIFENAGVEVPPSGVRLIGYVKDELLPALYSASELFVYPSLYEGFGLPVIEAMASGVPVVTSTITSLPEIAGRAAELVDPFDIESIAQGIRNVVNNTNIQDRFINPGLERASQFTWDQTARATWQTLMEAAGN